MFPEKLDNVAIGQNIAKFRRLKELKALDVAEQLGLKESAYTKYERGETAITIDFIQRIADILEISPFNILMATKGSIIHSITNSNGIIGINTNNNYQPGNEQHISLMLKLMESVISLNDKLVGLLDKSEVH